MEIFSYLSSICTYDKNAGLSVFSLRFIVLVQNVLRPLRWSIKHFLCEFSCFCTNQTVHPI